MRKILIFFECLNLIVGAGSPVPELEDQSKECGLDNLEFHDQDTEAPKERPQAPQAPGSFRARRTRSRANYT